MVVPLSSTKTNCSGSSWATASRQAVRACSSRTARLPVSFFLRPAQAADGPPDARFAQLLAGVLGPPGAVLQHRGIGGRFQPRPQRRLLLGANAAGTAGNGFTLQRASLAVLHHGTFHGIHAHVKAA